VVWRIVHLSFNLAPPRNITNLFGNWLAGVSKKERAQSELVHVLFSGRCGMCEMIIFLTKLNITLLCRLSRWLRIGSVRGPSYNQWTSDRKWILGATAWNWSHGIYTTSPSGVLIFV
jgi:hypothetical protein